MGNELLQKLENKIQNTVETIELLKLQIEELAAKSNKLAQENAELKTKQVSWEQNLHNMLEKLNSVANVEQQLSSKIYNNEYS